MIRITQRLKNKTAREGLILMAIALMGFAVFSDYAFRDFSSISFSDPWTKVLFDLSLLGAVYSFFLIPIALAATFGFKLWKDPSG